MKLPFTKLTLPNINSYQFNIITDNFYKHITIITGDPLPVIGGFALRIEPYFKYGNLVLSQPQGNSTETGDIILILNSI